jgi:hypothetical protein
VLYLEFATASAHLARDRLVLFMWFPVASGLALAGQLAGLIGLMEPLETPSNQGMASESRSFSRFHGAPHALFGVF